MIDDTEIEIIAELIKATQQNKLKWEASCSANNTVEYKFMNY